MARKSNNGKSRRSPAKVTLWQALNEPIVEVSEGFARMVFGVTIAIMLMAWVGPYWGVAQAAVAQERVESRAYVTSAIIAPEPRVAGAKTVEVPIWYQAIQETPGAVAGAFTEASYEILDVSEPLSRTWDFYRPGFQAVRDAWLELMADPV